MENKFVRVRSVRDIILVIAILVVGCVVALLPFGTSLNLSGCLLIPCALLALFVMKSEYKNVADGCRYKKKVFNFPNSMEQSVVEALMTNPGKLDVRCTDNSSALRLDVYYGITNGKAFLQLFKYIPYQYEARTKLVEYGIEEIPNLVK